MMEHKPVMLAEAIDLLDCKEGDIIFDCTLGGGGHAEVILERIGDTGRLIGIDTDEYAIGVVSEKLKRFGQRLTIVRERYENVDKVAQQLDIDAIDGALIDLGASAFQFMDKSRGFSYFEDFPLDMRMDQSKGMTAADVVNDYSEQELTEIFKKYGNDRWSSRIAKFIVDWRKRKRIETTLELVDVIKAAIPASARRKGGHPARKTFQALRIEVNSELTDLARTIEKIYVLLKENGRLVVLSYHSLEDRIVKHKISEFKKSYKVKPLTKKPLIPSDEEIETNPSARSAKLRAFERIA